MSSVSYDVLREGLGLTHRGFAQLQAVAPGGGLEDLVQSLRSGSKPEWSRLCTEHAIKRAEEILAWHKDGDLYFRTGSYFWVWYHPEFYDALRAIGCRRFRGVLDEAEQAFVATIEQGRTRRLGPPETRHLIDFDNLESSPTLGDLVDEEAAR